MDADPGLITALAAAGSSIAGYLAGGWQRGRAEARRAAAEATGAGLENASEVIAIYRQLSLDMQAEFARLEAKHKAEIDALRTYYEAEIDQLSSRIAQLEKLLGERTAELEALGRQVNNGGARPARRDGVRHQSPHFRGEEE